MKKSKFALSLILLVLSCALLTAGCSNIEAPNETSAIQDSTSLENDAHTEPHINIYSEMNYNIKENIEKFKITGRYSVLDGGISWDWSASGIEFNADCIGNITLDYTTEGNVWFRVWVDGKESENIFKNEGEQNSVVIAEGLEKGEHTVKIVRMTDVKSSKSVLCSITLNGELNDAPEDKPRFIEFYGDSLTCGTGVLECPDPNAQGQGGYQYMDATRTFAYLLANEHLGDCDYSFVSIAGSHVATSTQYENFLDVYRYSNYRRDTSEIWEYERHPDLIVVNLGTNDAMQNLSVQEYQANLGKFINDMRALHGADIKMLFVNNMMVDNYISYQSAVIEAKGGAASGLYAMSVSETDRSGASTHTSAKAHARAAEEIAAFIKQNNIWQS